MTSNRIAASVGRNFLTSSSTIQTTTAGPSRLFATSSTKLYARPRFFPPPPPIESTESASKLIKETDIRNAAIRSKFVRLVDPTSGGLAGPFNKNHLLNKMDLDSFYLQQVVQPNLSGEIIEWDQENPPKDGFDVTQLKQFPVCKIINKKEEIQRQLARRQAKRQQQREESLAAEEAQEATGVNQLTQRGTSKEVHITWSTTPHDMTHKLANMRTQLLKGCRINVVISAKSKGKFYTPGKDLRRDHEYHRLIARVDEFMCKKQTPTAAELNSANREEIDVRAPLATANITAADETVAKRIKDVDWKFNRGVAYLAYELHSRN